MDLVKGIRHSVNSASPKIDALPCKEFMANGSEYHYTVIQ